MWKKVKSFLVVVVITVLIWLVADQNVQKEQLFRIPVHVSSRDPDRYAAIYGPSKQVTLHVMMSGRRRHLKAFGELVNATGVFELVIDRGQASGSKPQTLSAENDILRGIEAIRQSPVTIKSVSPPNVQVIVDDFTTVANIAVKPDFGDLKVPVPRCSPDTVSVRLPKFAVSRLPADRVIRPDAEARVQQALNADSGDPEFEVSLPLVLDLETAVPLEFIPDKVTVTGVVEARQATAVKGPVQITFSVPEEVQARFSIAVDPGTNLRRTIEVTGPKNLLDQLDPHEIRAFVDVMAADMDDEPGKKIARTVQYVLPPGFTLASNSPPNQVVFRLVPRPAAAPAGQ
ncbi:MAG: hypothetical protein JXQ75_19050 [Phycisphaerae bacterium]|nr:hypothetical protein [Phycisphaerae bacterium]